MRRVVRWRWLIVLVMVVAGLIAFWPRSRAVHFSDVTASAGLSFRHVNGATGQKLLPETMGSGVVVFDYDSDGWPDLYFVQSGTWPGSTAPVPHPRGALFRNLGNGQFSDQSNVLGDFRAGYGLGACAADYDQDGFTDLLITELGGLRLLRNIPGDSGRCFADVTAAMNLPVANWRSDAATFWKRAEPISFPASAAWVDYDLDGWPDLFVCQYLHWSPAIDLGIPARLSTGQRAYVPPTQFGGVHSQLFRNLAGRGFQDVSAEVGLHVSEPNPTTRKPEPLGKALGVIAEDLTGDGYPELVIANDTVRNFYFENVSGPNGQRRFEERGLMTGLALSDGRPRGGMGIDTVELEPNERAVVIVNFTNEPNSLFVRRGSSSETFYDRALTDGLAAPSRGPMKFGAFWFDYDLDGECDLLTANGHLEPDIASAQPGQRYAQAAQLFRRVRENGAARFVEQHAAEVGPHLFQPLVGRGAAYLDYDRDGDLDIVLTSNGGPAMLLENRGGHRSNWVQFHLTATGDGQNREALGAVVEVQAGERLWRQSVRTARGYLSQSELVLTFGLGPKTRVDRLTITWPNAARTVETWADLTVNQRYSLGSGQPPKVTP